MSPIYQSIFIGDINNDNLKLIDTSRSTNKEEKVENIISKENTYEQLKQRINDIKGRDNLVPF